MMQDDMHAGRLVIFTDLDGTLIDRRTYDHREALPALQLVKEKNTPLIFCSSKTRAEQDTLRARLGITDPFIIEDGGAVYIERGYFPFPYTFQRSWGPYHVIEFGTPYSEVRRVIPAVIEETGILLRGYGDMDTGEVAALTGLDAESASRAKEREYEETLVVDLLPADLVRLERAFTAYGLTITRGSRFYGLKGSHDKGTAVRRLIELYRQKCGAIVSAGIGDGANDEPLLAVVDRPYLVERAGGGWVEMSISRLRRINGIGPAGWRAVIYELLG